VGEERLYPIAPDLGKFDEMSRYFPGVTPDGTQMFVARSGGLVCAHRFDAEGRYLGREFRTTDWADAFSWARELGLAPATIRVRKFHSGFDGPGPDAFDGPTLAILDQPSWFEDGALGSEEEREQTLRWWQEIGGFVLRWDGVDHTLDGTGKRFQ
jgi:hypothetical protein